MRIKSEKGYTLIEIFVVMSLTGLIIGFTYAVYGFGMRSFEEWSSANELYHEAGILGQRFQDDIYKAAEVIKCAENEIELMISDRTLINYQLNKGRLLRNGQPVLSEEIRLRNVRFTSFEEQAGLFPSQDNTCNEMQGIGLKAELSNKYKRWIVDLPVKLRQAAEWN